MFSNLHSLLQRGLRLSKSFAVDIFSIPQKIEVKIKYSLNHRNIKKYVLVAKLLYNLSARLSVKIPMTKMLFSRLLFKIDSWNFWQRIHVQLSFHYIINLVHRSLGHVSFFEFMRLDILENFKNHVYIHILYPKLSIPIWFILIIRNTIFIYFFYLFAIILFYNKYAGI